MMLPKLDNLGVITPLEGHLRVTLLRRRGKTVELEEEAVVPFKSNLIGDDPDISGRELRDEIRSIGTRPGRWLVCIPPQWLVSERVPVPAELALSDEEDYLWLQAEERLPLAVDQIELAVSRCRLGNGRRDNTLFAVSSDRLNHLRQVFREAGLRLQGFLPAAVGLLEASEKEPHATLAIGAGAPVLQLSAGGGILALRALTWPSDATDFAVAAKELERQVRLILAGASPSLQADFPAITVVGEKRRARGLLEAWNRRRASELTSSLPLLAAPDVAVCPAAIAVNALYAGSLQVFSPGKKPRARAVSRRRLVRAVPLAAAVLAALVAMPMHQQMRLQDLQKEMAALHPVMNSVEQARLRARELSPWYRRQPDSLDVLRTITRAFPEEGTVWLTLLSLSGSEAKDVKLTGAANDIGAWMEMQDALRRSPQVRGLRLTQTRHNDRTGTMTFELTFAWRRGGNS